MSIELAINNNDWPGHKIVSFDEEKDGSADVFWYERLIFWESLHPDVLSVTVRLTEFSPAGIEKGTRPVQFRLPGEVSQEYVTNPILSIILRASEL